MQQFIDDDKVVFEKLCMPRQALLWWEDLCECKINIGSMQAVTWDIFKASMNKKFYPLNYWKLLTTRVAIPDLKIQSIGRCLYVI